ncbi:Rha family transcriptional regulator [Alloscardovia omnicolens]|uniref:Rha family transcriptional regulator n=1 Tax=Alloscardovia omnicolens TaxID=419015 RepID=UPI003A660E00
MKYLIPKDEYGVFADAHDTARVDSRVVAKVFQKNHQHVMRDIRQLDCSKEFRLSNFGQSSYINEQGKTMPCCEMTRDGFVFLCMGYRGKKAGAFKEAYIKRFNEMERFIETLVSARKDFPLLTENIRLIYDNPRAYHYSNECDMLNRIVLGLSAKQFREAHGIPKGKSIRPYLSQEQIEMIETLQKVDVGLLVSTPDFQSRKRHLEWYAQKLKEKTNDSLHLL